MTKLISNFFTKDLKKCRLIQSYLHGTKLQSWGNRSSFSNILHAVYVHHSFHITIVVNRNFLVNRFVLSLFKMLFFYSGVEAAMNWVLEHMEDSGMIRFPFH